MTTNEAVIRRAYQVAENKDISGWVNCFTADGTFTDESIGVTYRGREELGRTVEVYAAAFPDMHRELYAFYVVGDTGIIYVSTGGSWRPVTDFSGTVNHLNRIRGTGVCNLWVVGPNGFVATTYVGP